jgi:hypothetical protein
MSGYDYRSLATEITRLRVEIGELKCQLVIQEATAKIEANRHRFKTDCFLMLAAGGIVIAAMLIA